MTLVNDPLFSREAVEQYEDKPLKPHKPKKIQNYAVKENQETRNEKIQSAQFLKTNMTLRSSQQFWNNLLRTEVRPFRSNKRLCYGCLEGISKEHNAKSCSNRRQCKVCNGKHPTILHRIKIEKNKSKKGIDEVAATLATTKS